ncbi:hypothetical protein B0H65DRAFT_539773 [Neurospora tetraspora]|uniref:Uncharacterized protein n=1 Tax=Neurospora tetraspora TaxID=94610 RepID=A0AAE0MS02_9PEZI|nr:hypothetical protein B0H65DRAFT_539773 [Neurospora tetraspora]
MSHKTSRLTSTWTSSTARWHDVLFPVIRTRSGDGSVQFHPGWTTQTIHRQKAGLTSESPRVVLPLYGVEGSMMTPETGELCEYCAASDFEPMRLLTLQGLQALTHGKDLLAESSFSYDSYEGVIQYSRPGLGRDQRFGKQSRIDSSAASCPLCQAISSLVRTSGLYTAHREFFDGDPDFSLSIYCNPVDRPAIEIPKCARNNTTLRELEAETYLRYSKSG